jgi:hypothetical protein
LVASGTHLVGNIESMAVECAGLVMLGTSSDLVEISILVGDCASVESFLDVENLVDVFITGPGVLDLGGGLGLQINLVQFNRLEVFDVGSRVTG